MMRNARRQAETYVFLLDTSQPEPPFLIVCDVGHCLELYADFTGTGRAYGQFPDRKGFRIFLEDLRDERVRERLKRVWSEPHALDPTKHAAAVTRDIAKRLAEVSKALEARGCHAEDVAHFLSFKRGGFKRVEQKVAKALNTLMRYGRISALDDARFVARKAA